MVWWKQEIELLLHLGESGILDFQQQDSKDE